MTKANKDMQMCASDGQQTAYKMIPIGNDMKVSSDSNFRMFPFYLQLDELASDEGRELKISFIIIVFYLSVISTPVTSQFILLKVRLNG
jgi:hypothetical protein